MNQLRIGVLLVMLFGMMASSAYPPVYAVTTAECCCSPDDADSDGSCPCPSKDNCCSQCVLMSHLPYACETYTPLISPALPPQSAPVGDIRTAEELNEVPPLPPPES